MIIRCLWKYFTRQKDTWSHPISDLICFICWYQYLSYVCHAFFLTLYFEHPTVLSRLYGYHKTVWNLQDMVNSLYLLNRFLCIKSDLNFQYSSYLQTVLANINNRSPHYTYLRTVMCRYVYVTLYVYVTCLIETSLVRLYITYMVIIESFTRIWNYTYV